MRRRVPHILAAAALVGAMVLIASRLEPGPDRPYDVESVPKASAMRWLSLGHPTLVANLYWLRTVQYIGEPQANRRGWDRLLPLVELVTDLDPRHGYAYQVAGTILGSVHRVDESNAILEKGMRNVPDRYILPFLRAFNAFYYEGDYALAGQYVERAASVPGAPEHLRQNVLAMYVKGNRADAAIAYLTRIQDSTHDQDTRRAVETQLRQAYLERDAAVLDEAIDRYRKRYFVAPFAIEQLVRAGLLSSIPRDPFGGEYVLGHDGRVCSSVHPFRFGRPEHPAEMRGEPGVHPERYREFAR